MPATHAEMWVNRESIVSLRLGINALLGLTDKNTAYIADKVWQAWCEASNLPLGTHWVTSKTISRFCNDKTDLKSDTVRTSLLIAISDWAERVITKWDSEGTDGPRAELVACVKEIVSMAATADAAGLNDGTRRGNTAQTNRLQLFVELFSRLVGINADDMGQPVQQFFTKKQQETALRSEFIAYRFGSKSGSVVKSFFTIKGPDRLSTICQFGHFYTNDAGRKRVSRGVVVPFEKIVAFVGNVDHGDGIEVLVFRKQKSPQNLYDGLILTFNDSAEPITGRVVLNRTELKSDTEINAGLFNVAAFEGEELALINRIRNRIHFSLEKDVNNGNRKLIQSQIVMFIANMLHVDGKELLTFDDGEAFNPAADHQYTFNSALGFHKPEDST